MHTQVTAREEQTVPKTVPGTVPKTVPKTTGACVARTQPAFGQLQVVFVKHNGRADGTRHAP